MWDLSLPGYKYLGPGNSIDKGAPTNANDLVAYIHDLGYGKIIERGGNPYLQWSEADAKAYSEFTTNDYGGALGKAFFGLKKKAYEAGLISNFDKQESDMTRNSRLRGKGPIPGYDSGTRGRQMVREQSALMEREETTRKVSRGQPPNQVALPHVDDEDADLLIQETDDLLSNLPRDDNMNGGGDEPMPESSIARASGPGDGGSKVSKETPVTPYPSLTYGLQETHTTILPYRGYCSVITGGSSAAGYAGVKLELRMNGIWDCVVTNVETTLAGTTPGIYGVPLIQAAPSTSARTSNKAYPIVHTTDPVTAEGPAWRNYWAQLYEYYTVLGCKYKITINSADSSNVSQTLVAYDYDGYTSGTGNILPNATLGELYALKGIKYAVVKAKGSNQHQSTGPTIIEGTYTPGEVRRNIQNDGDVKLWTSTSTTATPPYTESLHLRFYTDPLDGDSATNIYGSNIEIQMDYIVQYKDLRTGARYPITGATAITQSLPTDALIVSTGTAP